MDNNDRFDNWNQPEIEHGKLTKWNWIVQHPQNLVLGEKTDIGSFTYINAMHGVEIGNGVQIGSHCSIYSISTIDNKMGKVVIGEGALIGTHSVIMPGITVGKNSIIGAHSFVTKNVPENVIVAGVPAKLLKRRDE